MIDIRHMLLVDAPTDVVYKAITEQGGLAAWWKFETIATPEAGAIIEFKFGDRYLNKMKVLTLDPNRLVEWECIEGDEQWGGHSVQVQGVKLPRVANDERMFDAPNCVSLFGNKRGGCTQ